MLQLMTGVFWVPQATRNEVPEGPRLAIMDGEIPKPSRNKRFSITKRELEEYGYTTGRPACNGVQIGRRNAGVYYSDLCYKKN